MSKPSEPQITGWSEGHRVWLADTFDGVRLARVHGEHRVKTMFLESQGSGEWAGYWLVRLATGTRTYIRQANLRLSPPRGLTNQRERTKETKAPKRKEAVDPGLGYETTIFDHLSGAS